MNKVSIIVPAYNAEKTIKKCINSIIKQNFKSWELLIIENGSTDNTSQIVEGYAKNPHIFLYHSKKGVSFARNEGIKQANGEWIWFVDADDEVTYNVSQIIPEKKNEIGLIIGNYKKEDNVIEVVTKTSIVSGKKLNELKLTMLRSPTKYMTVWSKLFRADIIKKYNLFFNTSLKVAEDSDFLFRYLNYVRVALEVKKTIYKYSLLAGSTVRTISLDNIENYQKAMEEIEKAVGRNKELNHGIYQYIVAHFFISMVREVFANKELTWVNKIKLMREVKNKKVYMDAFQNLNLKDLKQAPYLLPGLFLKYKFNFLPAISFKLKASLNKRKENEK